MTATTAALTITADTDVEQLVGQHVIFTIAGAGNKTLTRSGRFETLKHMDFGNSVTGVGGMFQLDEPERFGHSGRTSILVPDGTTVFLGD